MELIYRTRYFLGYLIIGMVCCHLPAQANEQSALKSVQQDIAKQQQQVAQQQRELTQLRQQLAQQEKNIAAGAQQLHQTQRELTRLNKQLGELATSIDKLQRQQQQQQQQLAKQLNSAFKLGKYSALESMFNVQQSQRNDRVLVYYHYLNQARQQSITALSQTTQTLQLEKEQLAQQQSRKQTLVAQREAEQKKLTVQQQQREKTRQQVEKNLQQSENRLAELRKNEQQLQQRIAQITKENQLRAAKEARTAEQIKQRGTQYQPTADERALMARTSGIGSPNHQLSWPVKGKIINSFGQPWQGELRWKGLTIEAREGSEVKSIAAGQVILADWLQGYGLVVIVEHGKGDMSLYGYNQSSLVKVGDQITAGDPIALVGNTGGERNPALYFEIRRQGRALDPLPWLKNY